MRTTTQLRELLASPGIVPAPGAYDCLSAAVIERAGFPVVYMTGAGTSISRTGYPDIGLTTMSEMVANAAAIARTVSVPVIADADTGYGDVLQVQRTVREYERAGVAGIHIEDQESPKRCGHLDDKRVVPQEEMVRKLRAALDAREDDDFTIIARCDALAVTGWDDALRRCEAYVNAGADVLFLEALQTREQAAYVTARFDVPVLYNYVETGKSPPAAGVRAGGAGVQARDIPHQRDACRAEDDDRPHARAARDRHDGAPRRRPHGQHPGVLRHCGAVRHARARRGVRRVSVGGGTITPGSDVAPWVAVWGHQTHVLFRARGPLRG